jgi:hypothetical protein
LLLNDYLVLKGVKTNHCLDLNTTTELLELLYDDLDFRPDARRRPRRRVATGLERTRLRRPRQSRSGANGRRPPGPTPATGAAPAQRGAAPARTFTDASPTRTSQPHLAAAAPTRRGAAEHLPAPRGPTTRTAASADRQGPAGPSRSGARRGVSRVRPGRAGQLADYPLLTA